MLTLCVTFMVVSAILKRGCVLNENDEAYNAWKKKQCSSEGKCALFFHNIKQRFVIHNKKVPGPGQAQYYSACLVKDNSVDTSLDNAFDKAELFRRLTNALEVNLLSSCIYGKNFVTLYRRLNGPQRWLDATALLEFSALERLELYTTLGKFLLALHAQNHFLDTRELTQVLLENGKPFVLDYFNVQKKGTTPRFAFGLSPNEMSYYPVLQLLNAVGSYEKQVAALSKEAFKPMPFQIFSICCKALQSKQTIDVLTNNMQTIHEAYLQDSQKILAVEFKTMPFSIFVFQEENGLQNAINKCGKKKKL